MCPQWGEEGRGPSERGKRESTVALLYRGQGTGRCTSLVLFYSFFCMYIFFISRCHLLIWKDGVLAQIFSWFVFFLFFCVIWKSYLFVCLVFSIFFILFCFQVIRNQLLEARSSVCLVVSIIFLLCFISFYVIRIR